MSSPQLVHLYSFLYTLTATWSSSLGSGGTLSIQLSSLGFPLVQVQPHTCHSQETPRCAFPKCTLAFQLLSYPRPH